jgi:acetyl esterase
MPEAPDFSTEDFDLLEGTDRSLRMRLFKPVGIENPPIVVDLHGGGWVKGKYEDGFKRCERLARAGIAAAEVDFRHGANGYPTSLIDINYAIRWIKANAERLGVDISRFGLCGQSAGGHLAMLATMRPFDKRYTEIALPEGSPDVDAAVDCVCMTWPVINPLSRYHQVLKHRALAEPPDWVGDMPERHELYWKTEEAMAEGSPQLILERGEKVKTPPAIWIQSRPNPVQDYVDPNGDRDILESDRFAENYRKAGGEIELTYVDQVNRGQLALDPMAAFFTKQFF